MDVKRIVGFVLLGSALGIVFFVFYFLLTGSDEDVEYGPFMMGFGPTYTGRVQALDDDRVVIVDRDNVKRTFQTDNNTRVTMRGSERLKVGAEVLVRYKLIHSGPTTTLMAKAIHVLAPRPSPSPSASARPAASASPTASPSG